MVDLCTSTLSYSSEQSFITEVPLYTSMQAEKTKSDFILFDPICDPYGYGLFLKLIKTTTLKENEDETKSYNNNTNILSTLLQQIEANCLSIGKHPQNISEEDVQHCSPPSSNHLECTDTNDIDEASMLLAEQIINSSYPTILPPVSSSSSSSSTYKNLIETKNDIITNSNHRYHRNNNKSSSNTRKRRRPSSSMKQKHNNETSRDKMNNDIISSTEKHSYQNNNKHNTDLSFLKNLRRLNHDFPVIWESPIDDESEEVEIHVTSDDSDINMNSVNTNSVEDVPFFQPSLSNAVISDELCTSSDNPLPFNRVSNDDKNDGSSSDHPPFTNSPITSSAVIHNHTAIIATSTRVAASDTDNAACLNVTTTDDTKASLSATATDDASPISVDVTENKIHSEIFNSHNNPTSTCSSSSPLLNTLNFMSQKDFRASENIKEKDTYISNNNNSLVINNKKIDNNKIPSDGITTAAACHKKHNNELKSTNPQILGIENKNDSNSTADTTAPPHSSYTNEEDDDVIALETFDTIKPPRSSRKPQQLLVNDNNNKPQTYSNLIINSTNSNTNDRQIPIDSLSRLRPLSFFSNCLKAIEQDIIFFNRSWELTLSSKPVTKYSLPTALIDLPKQEYISAYLSILSPILLNNNNPPYDHYKDCTRLTALYLTSSVGIASDVFKSVPTMINALALLTNLKKVLSLLNDDYKIESLSRQQFDEQQQYSNNHNNNKQHFKDKTTTASSSSSSHNQSPSSLDIRQFMISLSKEHITVLRLASETLHTTIQTFLNQIWKDDDNNNNNNTTSSSSSSKKPLDTSLLKPNYHRIEEEVETKTSSDIIMVDTITMCVILKSLDALLHQFQNILLLILSSNTSSTNSSTTLKSNRKNNENIVSSRCSNQLHSSKKQNGIITTSSFKQRSQEIIPPIMSIPLQAVHNNNNNNFSYTDWINSIYCWNTGGAIITHYPPQACLNLRTTPIPITPFLFENIPSTNDGGTFASHIHQQQPSTTLTTTNTTVLCPSNPVNFLPVNPSFSSAHNNQMNYQNPRFNNTTYL